jgi:hypothetical protein
MTDPRNYLIMLFIVTMLSFGSLTVYVATMLIKSLLSPRKEPERSRFEEAILSSELSWEEKGKLMSDWLKISKIISSSGANLETWESLLLYILMKDQVEKRSSIL